MPGLGLAFGEEVETLWSIIGKLGPTLKYCSTSVWRLVYDMVVAFICRQRANELPGLLARKHARAVAMERKSELKLDTKERLIVEQDSAIGGRAVQLRNTTLTGLHMRFDGFFQACNERLEADRDQPSSEAENADSREKLRNKYARLLCGYYSAVKGNTAGKNVTVLRDELAKYALLVVSLLLRVSLVCPPSVWRMWFYAG